MKYMKRFLPFLLALGLFGSATAKTHLKNAGNPAFNSVINLVNQKDLWAVRDWLKAKRVAINNKGADLSISGDLRVDWRNVTLSRGSRNVCGSGDALGGFSNNLFNSDFRLYFDYRTDKTWTSIKLGFENALGSQQGEVDQISLDRANMGYHLLDDGTSRLDVLVGRQRAYDLYDSEFQFNSTIDGFTGSYTVSFESVGDFLVHGGGYIVDVARPRSLWIIEAGVYNIADTGAYVEYSFADWAKAASYATAQNVRQQFIINQFTLGYVVNPDFLGIDIRVFGQFAWNATANTNQIVRASKGQITSSQGLAWVIAVQLGKLEKANDWAFQAQWQAVEAQAVPEFDVSGIGAGSSLGAGLFNSASLLGIGNGTTNYNGWELDLMYAITDEMTLELRFQRALSLRTINNKVKNAYGSWGAPLNYTNFEIMAIYGF